jgi:aldehyde:ferredoxin oxidoreductase
MGSKNLKAVAVRGTGKVPVADPERFREVCDLVRDEAHASHGWPHEPRLDPEKVCRYGQRFQACTEGCSVRCYDARFYTTVPAVLQRGRVLSGQMDCVAGLFPGIPGTFYDWALGFEAGFEIARIANDEGLNHWEILIGMVPWIRSLSRDGVMPEVDGRRIDLDDPAFWDHLLRGISRREGDVRAALAEGTVRAAEMLDTGVERMRELFPAWGYAGHWDGHGDRINYVFFPFWITSAVQWAVDTRDPISSAHGYAQNLMGWSRTCSPVHGLPWERLMEVSSRVYGTTASADPLGGYSGKAFPAWWEGNRSVMKDSLPVGDQVFPRIYSRKTPDNFARAGGMEGPDFERNMFCALTGIEWDAREMERASERVITLERALLDRNFARRRSDDESLVPYFEKQEYLVNPMLGRGTGMDAAAFAGVMDEYYVLRGWDPLSGRPMHSTMEELGLSREASELGDLP